jgi:PAS domain S-box-containing protein
MRSGDETSAAAPLEGLDVEDYLIRALLEQAPDGLVVADEQGRISLVNRGFEDLFGYDRAEVLGQPVEMLVPEELRSRHGAHRLRFRASPHRRAMGEGFELEAQRRDGTRFPVEISLSPLERDGGALTIATIRDVTDRRAAEREVRWVQRLLDATNDAVYVFRARDLVFIHVNAGAERQTGYATPELLSMGPLHLLPEYPERRLRGILEPIATEHAAPLQFETTIRRRDGTELPVEVVCEWLWPDQAFEPVYVATARDVTERHASERDLAMARQRLALSEDRERIARDLHDKVIQRLFATGLGLQSAASAPGAEPFRARLHNAIDDLDQAIREIRTSIFELHDTAGTRHESVRSQVLDKVSDATRLLGFTPSVRFDGPIDTVATTDLADALLATLQEALANIVRHAAATTVEVEISVDRDVRLRVYDDGVGFDTGATRGGDGLRNMRARSEARGGALRITRMEPSGTELTWSVPSP